MRVLVTGGAGFIGSAVVRHLVLQRRYEVLTVDKLTYAANEESLGAVLSQRNHRFLKADIGDRRRMEEAFQSFRPERVIHLAAESHVDRSISGADTFMQTNVIGTFVLLEAARGFYESLEEGERQRFRFLHVSTDEVYGSLRNEGRFTEETPYDPSSPYAASKASSDHLAKAWARTYGLPVVVSNCSNNYGPYQFPEKLIPLTILNALEGRPISVYGTGENVRDWLHVDDHVHALEAILDHGRPGRTYNVGGNNERRNIDVVNAICASMDRRQPSDVSRSNLIQMVSDRPGHDHRYAIDPSRIESELGWRAAIPFEVGIEATVDWYLGNRWWWQPLRDRYAGERLGGLEPSASVEL